MVNPSDVFHVEAWITNIIIVIASAVFLSKFSRIQTKNYGLYMILILNIADLFFPLLSILTELFGHTPGIANFLALCGPTMYKFSLLWSTAIAYFLFLVVRNQKIFDPKKFIYVSFLWCFSISVLYSLLFIWELFGVELEFDSGVILISYPQNNLLDQILYYLVFEVIGNILPIAITFGLYYKVYKELKIISQHSSNIDTNPQSVLWYSVIQMFCFLPGSFLDAYFMFTNQKDPLWSDLVSSLCNRSWGFLNLLAYWYVRYTNEDEKPSRQTLQKDLLDLDDSFY